MPDSSTRGSPKLTEEDLALFKEVQAASRQLKELLSKVRSRNRGLAELSSKEVNAAMLVRLAHAKPAHWENTAEQYLQLGLDSLRRSITKPTHF